MCEVLISCGGHPEPAAELSFVLILQLSFGELRMGKALRFGVSLRPINHVNENTFFSGGNINNRMTAHSLIYVLDLLQ